MALLNESNFVESAEVYFVIPDEEDFVVSAEGDFGARRRRGGRSAYGTGTVAIDVTVDWLLPLADLEELTASF